MWYSNCICGWPIASITKATTVSPYLDRLSLPSSVCPHKCLKLDNHFLTHTFQLNTPNHSTTCIREPMRGALNNPLTLTDSMSSQTRQHPPLSSSNQHFILLFCSVAPKLLLSNESFWNPKAETFCGINLDRTVGLHCNILECSGLMNLKKKIDGRKQAWRKNALFYVRVTVHRNKFLYNETN